MNKNPKIGQNLKNSQNPKWIKIQKKRLIMDQK